MVYRSISDDYHHHRSHRHPILPYHILNDINDHDFHFQATNYRYHDPYHHRRQHYYHSYRY